MKNPIKFFKKDNVSYAITNKKYRGYPVGELPARFGFIYNADKDQDGLKEWFNYKGLTYVEHTPSIWSYV